MGVVDLKEQFKPRFPEPEVEVETATTDVATFTVESDRGLVLAAPASTLNGEAQSLWEQSRSDEVASQFRPKPNPHFAYLHGRFVEADNPNRNGAFWTTQDLELAQATVTNGPLNWLHDERHIIGTLMDSRMAYREAADDVNTHIEAVSAIWKFIYPRETEVIEKASMSNTLWYSMECSAETVTCIDGPGRPGCGETFPYKTVMREPAKVCQHVREKSSIRRFNQPTFLGGAVIIPPVRPGWGSADATLMRQAAEVTETAHLDEVLDRKDAEQMVAMVIAYANGTI